MSFITFMNDKWFGEDAPEIPEEEKICWEILNTNRIMHIYRVMPASSCAICIEYENKNGGWFEIHETFRTEGQTLRRFMELETLLKEDKK